METILSIAGKPGLYKLVSRGNRNLIVETLDETHKRIPAFATDRVTSLGDIAMYTDADEVPLWEVLDSVSKKEEGKPSTFNRSGDIILSDVRKKFTIPVIIISAKETTQNKIDLLRLGADDYITKPFDMEEVLARIESNLRRVQFQNSQTECLQHNNLTLDLEKNTAFLNGIELSLTAKEFGILELLMKYPDKVFSKSNLFQSVWDTEYIAEDNTLNVHISNLRNKLKAICSDTEFIDTVWGIGYRLHKAKD